MACRPAGLTSLNKIRDSSEYTLLWLPASQGIYYVPATRVEWSTQEVQIALSPEDATDESFLAELLPSPEDIIVGYGYRVGICSIRDNRFTFEAGQRHFDLKLSVKRSDFEPSLEMSFGSTSADKLAELRARRLLLNENPAVESRDINVITRELFIRGMETIVRVERSPFPALFQQFGARPDRFLQIAWIAAVVQLKLSACVAEVVRLRLSLNEPHLNVSFIGRRKKQFQNSPPYEIQIEGSCTL